MCTETRKFGCPRGCKALGARDQIEFRGLVFRGLGA